MVETGLQCACRILRDTIGLDADSPLEKALAKANLLRMENWVSMDEEEIDCLSYDEEGKSIPLDDRNKLKVTAFTTLVKSKSKQSSHPSVLDCATLTHEAFVDVLTSRDFLKVVLKDEDGSTPDESSVTSESSYLHANELDQVDDAISNPYSSARHILREIMDLGNDSLLEKALSEASLMNPRMWFYLSDEQIDSLSYHVDGTKKALAMGDKIYLRAFIAYVDLKRRESSDYFDYDGSTLTPEEYDRFMGSTEYRQYKQDGMRMATAGHAMPATLMVVFNNPPRCVGAVADANDSADAIVDDQDVMTAPVAVPGYVIEPRTRALDVNLTKPKRAGRDFHVLNGTDSGKQICGNDYDTVVNKDLTSVINTISTFVYQCPLSSYGRHGFLPCISHALRNGITEWQSNGMNNNGQSCKEIVAAETREHDVYDRGKLVLNLQLKPVIATAIFFMLAYMLDSENHGKKDYEACYPFIGWLPVDLDQRPVYETSFYACFTMSKVSKFRSMSSNPTLDVQYVTLSNGFPIYSDKHTGFMLSDHVRGAMRQLLCDSTETVVAYDTSTYVVHMVINDVRLHCDHANGIRLAPLDGESIRYVQVSPPHSSSLMRDVQVPPLQPFIACSVHSKAYHAQSCLRIRGGKSDDSQITTVCSHTTVTPHILRMHNSPADNDMNHGELDYISSTSSFVLYGVLVNDCKWERVPPGIWCEPLPRKSDRVPPDIRNEVRWYVNSTAKSVACAIPNVDSDYGERNVCKKAWALISTIATAGRLANRVPPDISTGIVWNRNHLIQTCILNNRMSTAINGPNKLSHHDRSLSSYRKANPPDYQPAEMHTSKDIKSLVTIGVASAWSCFGDSFDKRKKRAKGNNILLLWMLFSIVQLLFTSQCNSSFVTVAISCLHWSPGVLTRNLSASRTMPKFDKQEWWEPILVAAMYLGNLIFDPGGLLLSLFSCYHMTVLGYAICTVILGP